ncbi:MAG: tautomerase family protein [Xenococcaceae cyanobacterium MO_167.B52]|nr:tautomerase family protein [Xenococcaceae cyanobacterium MO_167.B52]
MPYVQISLMRGRTRESIKNISDSVHQALIDEFKIPELDKFQIVNELDENNLIFPPEYLGIPHTKNIIYIHITAKSGRTIQMKKKLYSKIATYICEKEDVSKDDIFIVLSENSEENWSFGRGEAQLVKENHS